MIFPVICRSFKWLEKSKINFGLNLHFVWRFMISWPNILSGTNLHVDLTQEQCQGKLLPVKPPEAIRFLANDVSNPKLPIIPLFLYLIVFSFLFFSFLFFSFLFFSFLFFSFLFFSFLFSFLFFSFLFFSLFFSILFFCLSFSSFLFSCLVFFFFHFLFFQSFLSFFRGADIAHAHLRGLYWLFPCFKFILKTIHYTFNSWTKPDFLTIFNCIKDYFTVSFLNSFS